MVGLLVLGAVAAGVGLAGYFLGEWAGAVAAAALTLLLLTVVLLWLSAVLFQRFDVSVDMPA
jgi:hypothetical protein